MANKLHLNFIAILLACFGVIFCATGLNASDDEVRDNEENSSEAYEIYARYKSIPDVVYLNQRFKLEIEVLILDDSIEYNDFAISYLDSAGVKIIDEDGKWEKKANNTYLKTLIVKSVGKNFRLPIINISTRYNNASIEYVSVFDYIKKPKSNETFSINQNFNYFLRENGDYSYNESIGSSDDEDKKEDNYIAQVEPIDDYLLEENISENNISNVSENITMAKKLIASLDSPDIKLVAISKDIEGFSNIIASSIDILEVKTTQYNNKNYGVTFRISAKGSNLEDLNFPNLGIFQKQIYLETNLSEQYLEYEALVPVSISVLNLKYYSLNSTKFETIRIPIVLQQDLLSTQYGISPHLSNNVSYAKALLLLGFIVCFVIFYFTRHIIFVFAGVFFMFLFVLSFLKLFLNEVELKKGATVFVLPTTNSYIYKKIDNTTSATVVFSKPNWSKVLFDTDKVGWVKNEQIQK